MRSASILASAISASLLAIGASSAGHAHETRTLGPDPTCPACQNFYEFANHAWLDSAKIPPASASWGIYNIQQARASQTLQSVLSEAASDVKAGRARVGSREQIIGTFYASCMDPTTADSAGVKPLAHELAGIAHVTTPEAVMTEIGRLQRDGVPVAFGFSSEVARENGENNPRVYVPAIQQGTLALPLSDYFNPDRQAESARAMYMKHMIRTLVLAGETPAMANIHANQIIRIESMLAHASMTRAERDQVGMIDEYRVSSMKDLRALTPGVPWDAFFGARGSPHVDAIVIRQPKYLIAFANLLTSIPATAWQSYLRWSLITDASPFLSSSLAAEAFRFHKSFTGVSTPPSRVTLCVNEANTDIGEVVGRSYVKRAFTPAAKAELNTMVEQLRSVLINRIRHVAWMSASTRREALAKAKAFRVKIGYPDHWRSYSSLTISPAPFAEIRRATRRYQSDQLMTRIGQRPDRAEWEVGYLPQTPTAWANFDEIVFAAAFLQPPEFDPRADAATNAGSIGTVIAHEMTHLFTGDGASIDSSGYVRSWWTRTDSVRFAVLEERIVKQYDAYTILDSATHVDGRLTLDENMADIGGIQLAYQAMEQKSRYERRATPGDSVLQQHFFLGFARSWAEKARPEYVRASLTGDGHAPPPIRVRGALSDLPEFGRFYHCATNAPMNPPNTARAMIW